ncbi:MAG: hypothetical protein V4494_04340, partial [Chlamydiota bacterium]
MNMLNALEDITDSWKDDFQSEVGALEIILYSIEDGSISKWKGSFKEDIYISVLKLKKMVNVLLENYLQIPDPNISESAIKVGSDWLICSKCNEGWESNSLNAMVVCP